MFNKAVVNEPESHSFMNNLTLIKIWSIFGVRVLVQVLNRHKVPTFISKLERRLFIVFLHLYTIMTFDIVTPGQLLEFL